MKSGILMAVAALALAPAGCAMHDGSADRERTDKVHQAMVERDAEYHRVTLELRDADSIRLETSAYAGDMSALIDEMTAACQDMMEGGMMGGGMDSEMNTPMMLDLIATHQESMEGMNDPSAMHDACDQHSEDMEAALDEMQVMMDDMMGSSGHMGGMM